MSEIQPGALLGSGKVAEVFVFGANVIKLYRAGQGKEQAFREAAALARLEPSTLPVPNVHGVVQVDGRWGVVMSRAPGDPFAARMLERPSETADLLDAVARLQVQVNGRAGQGFPKLKGKLRGAIGTVRGLIVNKIEAVLGRLDTLPDGDRLCHGDFHPFNVMGRPDEAMIVDWLDATEGAPEADACRSYLLLLHNANGAAEPYLGAYMRHSGRSRSDVLAWLPVLAAARLAENVPDEEDRLIALMQAPEV